MDNNEVISDEVNYYNRNRKLSRSHSLSSGLSSIPRTAPNKILGHHNYKDDEILNIFKIKENEYKNNYIKKYNDDDDDDSIFFNFELKKRNFSISSSNPRETLAFNEQLPKKIDKALSVIKDSYEDLSIIEHESIINEMRNCYISFTSKLEICNNRSDNLESNSLENNSIETKSKSLSSVNKNNESISNKNYDVNEGISFNPVPLANTNGICTTGEITCEEKTSSEDILRKIHDNNNSSTNTSQNNLRDDLCNLEGYNKIKQKSESSLSNDSNEPVLQRRRSSLFQFLFKTRSRNNSCFSSTQVSITENGTSNNSVNDNFSTSNIDGLYAHLKSISNEKESSSSLLYNNENNNEGENYIHSPISHETSCDINDILNIGINTPILEEDIIQEIDIDKFLNSKAKDRKNSRNRRKSVILETGHDITAVLTQPNIELIGRKSFENNVISLFLAEKLRKILPPYYRECHKWELVFSVIDHGSSINTLLLKCQETHLNGSMILGILDNEGGIYGAYLSEIIHVSERFYGSGECFLWKLNNEKKEIEYYRGSVENQYNIVTEKSFIAFGGGNGEFGLYISSDLLNGYTTYCPTYKNPPLTPNGSG
ncbi:TLD-domain-containing protein [Neocallimastix sp. 'constans']